MGFLGSVFVLSISLTQNPVVLLGQCADTYKIPIYLFFFFLNHLIPVSTCAASLVIWEFLPFLSPSVALYPTNNSSTQHFSPISTGFWDINVSIC